MRALVMTLVLVGVAAGMANAAHLRAFDQMGFYTEAEFAAAIRPYTEAIARNASDAEAHHWLGISYLHVARQHRMGLVPFGGDFLDRAIIALERSMQLRPRLATLMPLINAYLMAGSLEKWQAAVERSLTLAPKLPLK